jgi:hypothetical protein
MTLVGSSQRLANRERTSNGPLGVVLVRDRCAEDGHDGVAGELLDRAVPLLELLSDERVIRREHGAHVLDVHPLGATRETDQVGEQRRDDLALLAWRGEGDEPRSTAGAKARVGGVSMVTAAANLHGSTLIHGRVRFPRRAFSDVDVVSRTPYGRSCEPATRKEKAMAMEQEGATDDEFGYSLLVPKNDERLTYEDPFSVFLVQVKSDSETGRLLHTDPLTVLRERASEMGLDDQDVRLQVFRVNAERPANPVRKSAVWIVYPGSTTAVGVEYKYEESETREKAG